MSTTTTLARPCAVPSMPFNELATAQLLACAENALSSALFHLRRPTANVPGAARKAVQALAALNQLRALPLELSGSTQACTTVEA